MLQSGNIKKERRNPNDPARFVGKTAVTEDGEAADIRHYLDTDKIEVKHFMMECMQLLLICWMMM